MSELNRDADKKPGSATAAQQANPAQQATLEPPVMVVAGSRVSKDQGGSVDEASLNQEYPDLPGALRDPSSYKLASPDQSSRQSMLSSNFGSSYRGSSYRGSLFRSSSYRGSSVLTNITTPSESESSYRPSENSPVSTSHSGSPLRMRGFSLLKKIGGLSSRGNEQAATSPNNQPSQGAAGNGQEPSFSHTRGSSVAGGQLPASTSTTTHTTGLSVPGGGQHSSSSSTSSGNGRKHTPHESSSSENTNGTSGANTTSTSSSSDDSRKEQEHFIKNSQRYSLGLFKEFSTTGVTVRQSEGSSSHATAAISSTTGMSSTLPSTEESALEYEEEEEEPESPGASLVSAQESIRQSIHPMYSTSRSENDSVPTLHGSDRPASPSFRRSNPSLVQVLPAGSEPRLRAPPPAAHPEEGRLQYLEHVIKNRLKGSAPEGPSPTESTGSAASSVGSDGSHTGLLRGKTVRVGNANRHAKKVSWDSSYNSPTDTDVEKGLSAPAVAVSAAAAYQGKHTDTRTTTRSPREGTCSVPVAIMMILLSFLAPPFWILIAAGFMDRAFGTVPRTYKAISAALAATISLATLAGICVAFGYGLTH